MPLAGILWFLLAPRSLHCSGHLADIPFTGTAKQKKLTRQSGETDKVESTPNLQFELNIRGRRNGRLNSKHIRITTIQTSHHQWRYHYQTQAKRNNCNNQQRHENEAIK